MVLNIIDFNDNLKNSPKSSYSVYRNLELGHEIHVYNENSKLLKAAKYSMDNEVKSNLMQIHYSSTYEYYKLFLMLQIGGWFIESDSIFYSNNLNPEKTSPTYNLKEGNSNFISFCTWSPVFIKLDSITKFFLSKSLETLKIFIKENVFSTDIDNIESYSHIRELPYQVIASNFFPLNGSQNLSLPFFSNIQKDYIHFSNVCIKDESIFKYFSPCDITKVNDANNVINLEKNKDISYYNKLFNFDTFKIMP